MRMRDQSAGPVLMRRRSDSNGASDITCDRSDLESDGPLEIPDDLTEEVSAQASLPSGLGINWGRPSNVSTYHSSFEGGIAPAISAVLEQGTWVTKVTTKKTKRIKIWLDTNSARVCWHASKTAKSFFIDDVREIRVGADSRNARDDAQIPDDQENRWITVVYDSPERTKGRMIKTMHLMTPDVYITDLWADALNKVTRERIEIMNALSSSSEKSERSMLLAWRQAMARKGPGAEELFTIDEARWLCRKLEINCSDSTVRTHFTRSDTHHNGLLDFAQYQDFVRSFKERKDIQNLYRNLQCGTDLDMPLADFMDFLRSEQSTDINKDIAYWESVVDRFAKPATSHARLPDAEPLTDVRTINMQGFQNFLLSSYNAPLVSTRGEVVLDRPLNEYFISSSHNTYLLGRQVAGASSVEGYISALVKGCRCIEIDCWDGDDGRPMVTHGRTMTTKIPFADCVSVIAKYAFHSSPYPLIVSLEVHCGAEQQLAMVELMKKHWDNAMVTEPIFSNAISLPSPDDLRHKILVKVKAAEDSEVMQPVAELPNGRNRARSLGSSFGRTPSTETGSIMSPPLVGSPMRSLSPSESITAASSTPRGSTTSGLTLTPASSCDDSEPVPTSVEKPKKKKTSRIVPELGRLGVYTQGIKYSDFTNPESKTYNHVFSLAEDKFARLCTKKTDTKALLEKHNLRHLMRVYPAARRLDSSNFNPLQAWRRGVQMAALNWQTHDVHLQVNEAMFAAGPDRVGYVLKPMELRHARHVPLTDAVGEHDGLLKQGKKFVKFSVDIISAQRLPRPRNSNMEAGMNPYVEFEMYSAEDKARGNARGEGGTDASSRDGMSGIGSPLRKRTRVIEGNGFDPVFNQSIIMTVETRHPSLIFVRWTVWNSPEGRGSASNNVLLATFTAKLDSLRQGYRHLPLFNPHGEQYRDAKLFVRIRKDPAITMHHHDGGAQSIVEPAGSPRLDPVRNERSWPRRIFGRHPSERRKRDIASDPNGAISRASSMDSDHPR
ncbi:hypothetical protein AMS68_001658 [Peltaster fructicola]|uniref:Phosphoinositide phospholipase C n=1 Tax=Peltaster fructicola TaxID=286661 RepID=A0A6H0XNB2_9PEZI|nr:hypothetical protein AMS68_001658 [Peltaster fructicola]